VNIFVTPAPPVDYSQPVQVFIMFTVQYLSMTGSMDTPEKNLNSLLTKYCTAGIHKGTDEGDEWSLDD
jgi:hypothetical protein